MHKMPKKCSKSDRLSTLKNEPIKIFCGFQDFEYAQWKKLKPRTARNQQKTFENRKYPLLTVTITRKLPIWYLSTILALITGKATYFKVLQC